MDISFCDYVLYLHLDTGALINVPMRFDNLADVSSVPLTPNAQGSVPAPSAFPQASGSAEFF